MPRKVIIDTDPGIDDAVALTMALFDPRLEVVALTAAAGNVPAEQATRNVQAIVEQLDPPRWPRIGKANSPEHGLPQTAQHVFGTDGLGNQEFPVAELHSLHTADKILIEEVRAAPGEVTVICLGPLTNLSLALQRDPTWCDQVREIVIMGGAVAHPGNVTPVAEFNIHCDPEAAHRVFSSTLTKTLVPLDVTEPILFDFGFLNDLPPERTRAGSFLRRILPFLYRTHRQLFGLEGVHLHDAIALAAVLHPELFRIEEYGGEVEVSGRLTVGQTVFDRRRRPEWRQKIAVALECDAPAVIDVILRALAHAGRISS